MNLSLAAGATSTVQLGGNESIGGLSANIAAGGDAVVSEAPGKTLTLGGGGLTMSGAGTLELQTVPVLAAGSTVAVSGGTLRFNVSSGGSSLGPGTFVSISGGATLELAGTVSALGQSVNIANNSQSADGLLVSSAVNQNVGSVTGSGNIVVNAGASLTAYQIVQNSLTIGSGSTVTLAPSGSGSNTNPSGPNNINFSSQLTSLNIAGTTGA